MARVHSRERRTHRGYKSSRPSDTARDQPEQAPLPRRKTRRITNSRAKILPTRASREPASTDVLSEEALDKLNALNDRLGWSKYDRTALKDTGSADQLHATLDSQIRKENRDKCSRDHNGKRGLQQRTTTPLYVEKRGLDWSAPSMLCDDDDDRSRNRRHRFCKTPQILF